MVTLVYILRKAVRIGIPFWLTAFSFLIFGKFMSWHGGVIQDFITVVYGLFAATMAGYFGTTAIFLSVTWTESKSLTERNDIKTSIDKVKTHLQERKIARSHQLKAAPEGVKAGHDDPSIYDK